MSNTQLSIQVKVLIVFEFDQDWQKELPKSVKLSLFMLKLLLNIL